MNIFHFYSKESLLRLKRFIDNPWRVEKEGINLQTEREFETITAIGNGFIGTRNSLEESCRRVSTPATFISGLYEIPPDGEPQRLIKNADWTRIEVFVDGRKLSLLRGNDIEHKRYLDLRKGLTFREWEHQDESGRITKIKIIKFVSIAHKNLLFKSISVKPENYCGSLIVKSGFNTKDEDGNIPPHEVLIENNQLTCNTKAIDSNEYSSMTQKSLFSFIKDETMIICQDYKDINKKIKFNDEESYEQWEWQGVIDKTYNITSLVSAFSSPETVNPTKTGKLFLMKKSESSFIDDVNAHTKKWREIWDCCGIKIDSNDQAQKWINFAIYHLMISGKFAGITNSIPARTLTGEAYKGHVFWDTEIYLLPFFTLNFPDIAKNLLMYRFNTLEGARSNAGVNGFKGACFAWESTDSGCETTPPFAYLPNGDVIKIYSGTNENHISCDVAYAVWQYWLATEDYDFLINYGAEIIISTAIFCASFVKKREDGFYHIPEVVGPDEYHDLVDDNAYTNIMVKHNFEISFKAIEILKKSENNKLNYLFKKLDLSFEDIENWKEIYNNIYIGYDKENDIYEQFKGYFALDDINVKDYEPRTAAMDIILGREYSMKTKVVKQPDVLMFLFLLFCQYSKDIIKKNYEYYEPKTGHGSSLSPSIHSIIASWIDKKEDAYKYFKQNAQIDLENQMGNAAGGIHIASQGGTWMSIVNGFAGINIAEEGLILCPNIPDRWRKLEIPITWRGQRLLLEISSNTIEIINKGENSIKISFDNEYWKEIQPDKKYAAFKSDSWKWI